jgi:hypothetical protein
MLRIKKINEVYKLQIEYIGYTISIVFADGKGRELAIMDITGYVITDKVLKTMPFDSILHPKGDTIKQVFLAIDEYQDAIEKKTMAFFTNIPFKTI